MRAASNPPVRSRAARKHAVTPRHATAPQPVLCVSRFQWLSRPAILAAQVLPLLPLVAVVRPLAAQSPDLQVYAGDVLGLGATLCLLSCLAITPISRLVKFRQAARWRRWLGMCVFWNGAAGLVIAATGGPAGQWGPRLSGHAQAWTGTVIVVTLVPLALTSGQWAQKLLGSYWKVWQRRLTWAVWVTVAVHVLTLTAWRVEAAFLMASGPLLVARVPAVRKDVSRWKASGYADSALWVLSGAISGVFACGMFTLAYLEVVAGAQAIRLA